MRLLAALIALFCSSAAAAADMASCSNPQVARATTQRPVSLAQTTVAGTTSVSTVESPKSPYRTTATSTFYSWTHAVK